MSYTPIHCFKNGLEHTKDFDGLLYGLTDLLSPMAEPAPEIRLPVQVRLHLVCYLVCIHICCHIAGRVTRYAASTLQQCHAHQTFWVPARSTTVVAYCCCQTGRCQHVTLFLQELYRLWSRERVDFKLAVLIFRCLRGLVSCYLANDIADWPPMPALIIVGSTDCRSTRLVTMGDCAFLVAGCRFWDALIFTGLPTEV